MTVEDADGLERGRRKPREVYAGDVVDRPEGEIPFNDVMRRSPFAPVWVPRRRETP